MTIDLQASSDEPVIIETASAPTASVIFLHGLGANGQDFVPVVPELRWSGLPPIRFVFPNAPERPVTINGGIRMRAWYDIVSPDLCQHPDVSGVQKSAAALDGYIARQIATGIPSERIVIGGFSQGGAIALYTGIRYQHRLAGVLALSAYLPLPDTAVAEYRSHSPRHPIFTGHGSADEMIPLSLSDAASESLTKLGFRVEIHTYPITHIVSAEEIRDIANWLYRVF